MNKGNNPEYSADILVVDDTHDNLRLLSKLLMEQGYYVRPVSDGRRAISAIQEQLPDLILLDIMMPDMDGYEVCQHLQADELTRNIPIIFISALNETFDKVKAFSIGGRDYITKPFEENEVLARIKIHLELKQSQEALASNISELERTNGVLEKTNKELEEAMEEIKTLSGIIPICAKCKKIRDDKGYWNQLESYIEKYSDAAFSHGICPECSEELYGNEDWYIKMEKNK